MTSSKQFNKLRRKDLELICRCSFSGGWKPLGQLAYEAFWASRSKRILTPLKTWEQLEPAMKESWVYVGEIVKFVSVEKELNDRAYPGS